MVGDDLSPDESGGTEKRAAGGAAGEVERVVGERDFVIAIHRCIAVSYRSSMSSQDVVVAQEQ
jgi:hypothetical protein